MPYWSLNYVKIQCRHSWLLGSNSIFLYKLLDFLCLASPLCYSFDLRPSASKVSVNGNLLCEMRKEQKIPLKQMYSKPYIC